MEITIDKETLTLAFTAFITVWQVGKTALRYLAPKTATTLDDNTLAAMDNLEKKAGEFEDNQWIKDNGPAFWAQVEALSKTEIPALKGVGKLAYFLGLAHQAYLAAKGKGMGAATAKQLEILAAGLSASHKVGVPAGNPSHAPAVTPSA